MIITKYGKISLKTDKCCHDNVMHSKLTSSKTYPPFKIGFNPNTVHRPTDVINEAMMLTTAENAMPSLLLTKLILPENNKQT